MKIILLFLLSFSALAETAISPIVKGGIQQGGGGGPKQPIVTLPPSQPTPKPTPPEQPRPPQFWEVVSWYQSGRDVKWSEIKGSYVGTCIDTPDHSDNIPKFAFLTYLGSSQSSPEALITVSLYNKVNFQMRDLPHWLGRAQAQSSDNRSEFVHTPTFTKKNIDKYLKLNTSTETYRIFDNYLVSITTIVQTLNSLNRRTLYPGEIQTACYFTQKVTE